jgi:SAM-dependent methyltransferase
MAEVNLLGALPQTKRNIAKRKEAKDPRVIEISRQFDEDYFDGAREYGYGGYRYDGRWVPVARDIISHFGLKAGMRVLDIGCAKGFLIQDLMQVAPGLECFGLDISRYAMMNCHPNVVGRLHLGNAVSLPFPDASFDAVLSINTIHNLDRAGCLLALREMTRVCRDPTRCFTQVDAYRTADEKELFESWCLTAVTYLTPGEWEELFAEAGYAGDYYWTILEASAEGR